VTRTLVTDPLILARSVHIAATVLASGTVCFMALVADVPGLRWRLNVTVWCALAVAVLSGIGWLAWLAADILGEQILDVCLHGGVWQVASDTRFGMVWCARCLLAILLGVLMRWPRLRPLQTIVATLLIGSLALIGHAGATPGLAGRVHLVSDVMHLIAAGAWLGGLPAFVMVLTWPAYALDATRRFSRLGVVSVGALLASGAVNSWNLLGGPRDLLTTDYGRLVLAKIVLFAAMICLATVNRYHLTPKLSESLPAPAALRGLRRNGLCEIGLGLCVVAFVGVLGTLQPSAHVHTPPPATPSGAAFVHIHSSEAMADVTIDPGRAGTAQVTIRVWREDFSPFAAKEVRAAMDPPDGGAKTIERTALRMGDGTWVIDRLEFGQPGIWALRVIVTSGADKTIVLDAPVVIER
jgi:copper resistance protein D